MYWRRKSNSSSVHAHPSFHSHSQAQRVKQRDLPASTLVLHDVLRPGKYTCRVLNAPIRTSKAVSRRTKAISQASKVHSALYAIRVHRDFPPLRLYRVPAETPQKRLSVTVRVIFDDYSCPPDD